MKDRGFDIEFTDGDSWVNVVDWESGDFKRRGYATYIKEKGQPFASRMEFKTKLQALQYAKCYMRNSEKNKKEIVRKCGV